VLKIEPAHPVDEAEPNWS